RVPDRTLHFEPVAHDAGVLEQTLDTRRRELGHSRRMEVGEQPPIVRSFLEDGGPAQASLSGFEDQEFEQSLIVVHRHAPFRVMVLDVEGAAGPRATHKIWWSAHRN